MRDCLERGLSKSLNPINNPQKIMLVAYVLSNLACYICLLYM